MTGPEHGAEAARNIEQFAAAHTGHPGLPDVLAAFRETVSSTYISGPDDVLTPDLVDDRQALPGLTVPTRVIVGRHDVICGPAGPRSSTR